MASSSIVKQLRIRSVWPPWFSSALDSVLVALLAALLFLKGILAGLRSLQTDFPNYYVAARLIREHFSLDRIYDWTWFQRVADHFGIEHQITGFSGLTPFSAFPLLPIAGLPVMEAKRLWIFFNIGLLFISLYVLGKVSRAGGRKVWLIGLCAVIPLRNDFLFGQMHLLVLALLVASYVCHLRGRQTASGCLIALAGALKIYPFFFCLYFVVKKRWRALVATLLCATGCILLSFAAVGQTAMTTYAHEQLTRTLQGESLNPFLSTATSPAALFHRLFLFEPELNPHPLIFSPLLYAVLYSLFQAMLAGTVLSRLRFGFRPDVREAFDWASFVTLLLFMSSAPATYHYVVLIAPAVITIGALVKMRREKLAAVLVALYLVACNLGTLDSGKAALDIFTPLHYVRLWAGVGLLLFYFFIRAENNTAGVRWSKPFASSAIRMATIVLSLWIAGFVSAWSHVKHVCSDCAQRVTLSDSAYLRSAPADTEEGLLYIAMLRDGYRVLRAGVPLFVSRDDNRHSSDQLSYAASASGKEAWIEIATGTGSKIVRVASADIENTKCEIDDAESPALSSDGSLLAFLREDHGRGNLWLSDPKECERGAAHGEPAQITPSALDIRTVSAGPADDWIVSAVDQSSAGGEKEKIYDVSSGHSPRLLVDENTDLDLPSLSPGEERIVVRKRIASHWQLVMLNLSSDFQVRSEKQLTFGDCNAYTPSWKDTHTVLYATDCARGLGMTALAWLDVAPEQNDLISDGVR